MKTAVDSTNEENSSKELTNRPFGVAYPNSVAYPKVFFLKRVNKKLYRAESMLQHFYLGFSLVFACNVPSFPNLNFFHFEGA